MWHYKAEWSLPEPVCALQYYKAQWWFQASVNNVTLHSRLVIPRKSGNTAVLPRKVVDPWASVHKVVLQSTLVVSEPVGRVWYYKAETWFPEPLWTLVLQKRVVGHTAHVNNVVLKSKAGAPQNQCEQCTDTVWYYKGQWWFLSQCGPCYNKAGWRFPQPVSKWYFKVAQLFPETVWTLWYYKAEWWFPQPMWILLYYKAE